ncbi:MAG: methyltransferase domain-containing protein [Thermoplasmata archaeon]|nr:methyltransferase domain-containing protein [Thermoplasmata archaeon]
MVERTTSDEGIPELAAPGRPGPNLSTGSPRLRQGVPADGGGHPGGSWRPATANLAWEQRRYERWGGDHVARYRWARAALRDARVLDVGCGFGFGARLLLGAFREYVGVDLDRPAIEWARTVLAPEVPQATFLDTARLPTERAFDAVTCFEVVEHVDDPGQLLRDLRAAALPGARVFLSTPNGTLSAGRPEWFMSPYHVAEFTAKEFAAIVRAEFSDPGEFFVQRRVDRLDCAPQVLRLQLTPGLTGRQAGAGRAATSTPAPLRRGHAALRRIPSPASLWRIERLPTPICDGRWYSHLLWAGRSTDPPRR